MKKALFAAIVLGVFLGVILLVAGCSSGATGTTSTSAPGDTTTVTDQTSTQASDQSTGTSDTSGTDQGTTASSDQGTTASTDQSTDTTSGEDTTTTVPSETTTTTTPAQSGTLQTVTHSQSEGRLSYSGTWKKVSASSAEGGSLALANSSGASLTIRFIGTHIAWIAKESPAYGEAKVRVDGGAAKTVNLYSSSTVWKHTVWQASLKKGAHTAVISWTGRKSSSATGTNIDVDAIEITGVLTGRYQQTSSKFAYSGTWQTVSNSSASGTSFRYTNSSGASVTIRFSGIDLAWIAKTGPDYGKAKITVDGSKTYTISLYSKSVSWQKRLWSTGLLADGEHTVKIEWLGTKSSGSTGTYIDVDAIDVTGTLE